MFNFHSCSEITEVTQNLVNIYHKATKARSLLLHGLFPIHYDKGDDLTEYLFPNAYMEQRGQALTVVNKLLATYIAYPTLLRF